MGKRFVPFLIYKFRTMTDHCQNQQVPITVGKDPRITRVGYVLRQLKLDEFPQLINIVKREMNFVGPRPELRHYVELFRDDYKKILTVRPGLTDLASLKYRNENELLEKVDDPETEYVKRILPDKIRLAKEYIRRASPLLDLSLIVRTLLRTLG